VGVVVLRDVFQLLLYALLAAFSPLALAATMAAIGAGRRQALGLAVGFVAGQLVSCALFVILDFAAVGSSRRSYPGIRAPLALRSRLCWSGSPAASADGHRRSANPRREHTRCSPG